MHLDMVTKLLERLEDYNKYVHICVILTFLKRKKNEIYNTFPVYLQDIRATPQQTRRPSGISYQPQRLLGTMGDSNSRRT